MTNTSKLLSFVLLLSLVACQDKGADTVFTRLSPRETNIDFANNLTEDDKNNIIQYLYFYNGGGVAVGDVNNDGLPDLFFTSNQGANKLYLNKGQLKFEDVTEAAAVGGRGNWTTGATMADVNGDGYLDIYVCNVGNYKQFTGRNELFINNKNGTFTEQAAVFGLDFKGLATQAAFFDYDNDGDLDAYLLNHSVHDAARQYDASFRNTPNTLAGDRLLRNDGSRFNDVSAEAGIFSSKIGYGLGVVVSDLNQDGCMDIYVSNDFRENDYLYYNNCDGTFREGAAFSMGHQSNFSMGVDAADFNNDALPDLITLDMKPEDEKTLKKSVGADPFEIYFLKLKDGFHYQYPRNNLHLNQGTLFGRAAVFSEIAHLAGVEATDWSWSALFADLDNDGWKDLFISNGILRRPNDLNYLKFQSSDIVQSNASDLDIAAKMPDGKTANYAYQNKGDLTFDNVTTAWGLGDVGISNGAVYVDLDGDGDLDLVTNNLNEAAGVYRNNSRERNPATTNFLKIKLKGEHQNTFGIGAKVLIEHAGQRFYQEQSPTRGFQSSVDYDLNFGVGNATVLDSVTVIWSNGIYETLRNVPTNQTLILRQQNAEKLFVYTPQRAEDPLFLDATTELNDAMLHVENPFSDFTIQRLMTNGLSTEGPALAVGDVNGDGTDDVFLGGAKGKSGVLFLQKTEKGKPTFVRQPTKFDEQCEDVDAVFFDANGDSHLDLYVVSAGNEWQGEAEALKDRLYLNDGKGGFTKSDGLPTFFAQGSVVRPCDFDGDGAMDLFVGSRAIAGSYGLSPNSFLLKNDGAGRFKIVEAAAFRALGMVTDAIWVDVDKDKRLDLVAVGEFMPVTIFLNKKEGFKKTALPQTNGWWQSIAAADLDGDNDLDLVLGNYGANSPLTASVARPLELYLKDFDENGALEQILCYFNGQKSYPFASQDELMAQMPSLKKKYLKYDDYAESSAAQVFGEAVLAKAQKLSAYELQTVWAENKDGAFVLHQLPKAAQFSPVRGILVEDFDGNGTKDLLFGGNFYNVLPKIGRQDAAFGTLLSGDGKGNFAAIAPQKSGWALLGQARKLQFLTIGDNRAVLVARNDEGVQLLVWRQVLE